MKLLKKRSFAILLTVAVVLFSVLFGTGRSLRQLRSEAVDYFQNGADGVHSMQNDLDASAAIAANLCTVGERYLPESQDLATLKEQLITPPANYSDHIRLYDTATGVMNALERTSLSDQDAKYVRGFRTELESRLYAIQSDPYTEMARSFNETLDAFPVRLLRPLLFIEDLSVSEE